MSSAGSPTPSGNPISRTINSRPRDLRSGQTSVQPPPQTAAATRRAALNPLAAGLAENGARTIPNAASAPTSRRRGPRRIPRPYGPIMQYLFGLLRLPGQENEFKLADRISSRVHNLPLMPILNGDNPLSNVAPSKFLRLTDYQLFILKQWAGGQFIDEKDEGWLPSRPTVGQALPDEPPATGRGSTAACCRMCSAALQPRWRSRLDHAQSGGLPGAVPDQGGPQESDFR